MCTIAPKLTLGWYRVQLAEIMEGFGNTALLITNDNDDPPQLQLTDTMGSSLVWKGQFMHKVVSREQV